MFLFCFISIVFGVVLLFFKYSLWRHRCNQLMPGKQVGFFNVLGDLKDMFAYTKSSDEFALHHHFIQVLKERNKMYQKQQLFSWWASYVPFVFLVKADAVKAIMKGYKTIDKSWVYEILKPLSGSGLGNVPAKEWKPRRKLLTPCFHTDILRNYMDVFNEHSQKLVNFFHQETTKEFTLVKKPITLTALDILCETVFGIEIGAFENEDSSYVKSLNRLTEIYISRIYKFWQWPDILFKFTNAYREMKLHEQVCHDFATKVIREKRKSYLSGDKKYEKGKRKAVLDLLLELYSENGELSEEDIKEDVKVFIFAGHDTASIAMTWTLFLIGLYPDVQAKIHKELDRIFGDDTERYVTESDLNELEYLDCVIKETNRLYSPAPMFGRQIYEDTDIKSGHTIPKGASCIVLAHFLHRDEDVFPDPEKFDPDRFLPENSVNIPEFAFVPFAAGPRNCIGQRYATMEMKTMLSTILRSFTVESLDGRDKVLPLMLITLHPSIPIRLKIRSRKTHNMPYI